MSTEPGNTPAPDEVSASVEQRTIPTIDESQQAPEPAAEDTPPAPVPKKEDETPSDPRAARLEALAANAHQNRQEEAEAVAEVMSSAPAPAVAEPEPAPERMIKLKIRGEVVERPESEVIAMAQKVEAADQYLSDARDVLKEAKEAVRQPVQPQREEPAPAVEKVDAIAKAIEIIQTGGDPAEAKAILDTELSERATRAAEQVIDGRSNDQRTQRYDADYSNGFTEAAGEYQDILSNTVGQSTVRSLSGALQAHVIAEHLQTLTPEVQQAFSASGITPDTLKQYSPEDAAALYKDMCLKGYQLPRPSDVIKVAAKTVADQFGTTKPAPTPAPVPLDRTQRKEAINQPERTAIPKPTGRPPVPRTEPQRAVNARQEMRAQRRKGSA